MNPSYKDRVALDLDVDRGKANLNLSSVTLADNMEYMCRVQIPQDDKGKSAVDARLLVLGNLSLSCDTRVQSSFYFLGQPVRG